MAWILRKFQREDEKKPFVFLLLQKIKYLLKKRKIKMTGGVSQSDSVFLNIKYMTVSTLSHADRSVTTSKELSYFTDHSLQTVARTWYSLSFRNSDYHLVYISLLNSYCLCVYFCTQSFLLWGQGCIYYCRGVFRTLLSI